MYLSDAHKAMLSQHSGITPEVIAARGYFTATDANTLYGLGFSPKQCQSVPGLVIPIHTPDGGNGLYRYRPDKPRMVKRRNRLEPLKYEQPKGAALRLDVNPIIREVLSNPATPLCFVEGEKKADALISLGLPAVALPGVWGWMGRNTFGGNTISLDFKFIALQGRTVYVAFDSDAAEKPEISKAESQLSELLERKGADVWVIRLPKAASGSKQGVDDFIAAGHTLSDLLALAVAPAAPLHYTEKKRHADGLPDVEISGRHLREVTADALTALEAANVHPYLYVRSGALVRVVEDEHKRPGIQSINENVLRGRLARVANFISTREVNGQKVVRPQDPPLTVVRDLLAAGVWPFPKVTSIIECPALRPDGTVISDPGYDGATGLVYHPANGLSVPEIPHTPEPKHINAALGLLQDAVGDFPYADEASAANALAAVLTPILRPAVRGPVPLALIDATKAGTGKSLLASVIYTLATGQSSTVVTAPRDDDEWRKQITAALATGSQVIVIDNLTGVLYSGILAAALTSETWKDRPLGRNDGLVSYPQRAVWLATGNNIRLGGDIPRRSYWVRLDAKMSRPWQREGFKHSDLLGWVSEHRGALIAAALTLARAWYVAGCPLANTPKIGGFGEWVRVVGGVLAVAGVPGFLGNLIEMYEAADDEGPQWEAFLLGLLERFGNEPVTVGEICEKIAGDSSLVELVPDIFESPLDKNGNITTSFKKRLGRAFSSRAGTRFGDANVRLEKSHPDTDKKVLRWRLVSDVTGFTGFTEFPQPQAHAKTPKPFLETYTSNGASGGSNPVHPVNPVEPEWPEYDAAQAELDSVQLRAGEL